MIVEQSLKNNGKGSSMKTDSQTRYASASKEIERIIFEITKMAKEEDKKHGSCLKIITHINNVVSKQKQKSFQVAVIALTKSGKSTLLNAFLGEEYLPSSNTPETARIVRIRHCSDKDAVLVDKGEEKAKGAKEIFDYLKKANNSSRENNVTEEEEIILNVPLCALRGKDFGEQRFEILDTPGPNEAGVDHLKEKVNRLLSRVDVIIYLLDCTKLKTDDEQRIFKTMNSREDLLKDKDRLFFVINKFDQLDRNALKENELTDFVVDLLSKQLGLQERVRPERILTASARQGLLARLVSNGKSVSDGVLEDFSNIVCPLEGGITLEEARLKAPKLLDRSKINCVEDAVISYVFDKRGSIFFNSIIDDINNNVLKECERVFMISKAAAKTNVDNINEAIKNIEKDRSEVDKNIVVIEGKTTEFVRNIKSKLHGELKTFKDTVVKDINSSLGGVDSNNFVNKHFPTFKKIFASITENKKDLVEVREDICRLNKGITDGLFNEFKDFRGHLEREALVFQRDFVSEISKSINPIVNQMEQRIGKRLNLEISPMSIKIDLPDEQGLHTEINTKIEFFTKRSQDVIKKREIQKRQVKEGGCCSDPIYENVDVVVDTVVTTHGVDVERIKSYWVSKIDAMVENSGKAVDNIVKEIVKKIVDDFKKEWIDYCDLYINILKNELDNTEHGRQNLQERLMYIEECLERCKDWRTAVGRCKAIINAEVI
jgi:small GTP-binding protein